MTVNDYRAKKKRCRTCEYAYDEWGGWTCKAKNEWHCDDLGWTSLRGMFCRLYKPKQMDEGGQRNEP